MLNAHVLIIPYIFQVAKLQTFQFLMFWKLKLFRWPGGSFYENTTF